MRRLVYIVALLVVFASPLSAQAIFQPFGQFTVFRTVITLPDVVTPDGVKIPAGEYRIVGRRDSPIVRTSPPSVTLGLWPGPSIELAPLAGDSLDSPLKAGRRYTFETKIELRVLYGIPARPEMRPGFANGVAPETAPLIRNGKLVGFVIGERVLRIQSASSFVPERMISGNGVPLSRPRVVETPGRFLRVEPQRAPLPKQLPPAQ